MKPFMVNPAFALVCASPGENEFVWKLRAERLRSGNLRREQGRKFCRQYFIRFVSCLKKLFQQAIGLFKRI